VAPYPAHFVYIGRLDFSGKRVVDVGTGSGILALAAARAGAKNVTAVDINLAKRIPIRSVLVGRCNRNYECLTVVI
jgi:predicted RNA methylase